MNNDRNWHFFEDADTRFAEAVRESFVVSPKLLYHYTSGAGLEGILRSNTMWGGNYAFMNDKSEFQHAHGVLRETALAFAGAEEDSSMREWLQALADPAWLAAFDLYLTCFCEAEDLLSQWRGYGGGASRYCIAVDSSKLKRAERTSPPLPVLYDEGVQRAFMRLLIGEHIERAKTANPGQLKLLLVVAVRSILGSAMPLMVRFKSATFAEEREWRFVRILLRGNDDPKTTFFVNTDGMMKPYRTLLSGSEDGDRLPIVRIVAGAARSELQAQKSAELMTRAYGYDGVEVTASRVPLLL